MTREGRMRRCGLRDILRSIVLLAGTVGAVACGAGCDGSGGPEGESAQPTVPPPVPTAAAPSAPKSPATGAATAGSGAESATSNPVAAGDPQPAGTAKVSSRPGPTDDVPYVTDDPSVTEPGTPDRSGEDWPIFLGPQGTGVSRETELLAEWPPQGPPVAWRRKIGTGYSAPSVRGNRIVVHHRPAGLDEEIVDCLRADTGVRLWSHKADTSYEDPYGYNNGPRCSPLLTETHCFTYGAEGRLECLELETGKPVWSRALKQDYKLGNWFFGIGCSPILEEDRLIVLVGGTPNAAVVAFDPVSGRTLWESVGKDTWDGVETGWADPAKFEWSDDEMTIGYSSPIAATIRGRRQILCLVRQGLVSLDPQTGEVLFKYWFRSRTHESVNAARPLVLGNRILLTAAYQVGSALLEVAEDCRSVKEVWRDGRNLLAHWSTPLAAGDHVWGFSGRHENEGTLRCLKIETGEVVWETPGVPEERLAQLQQDPDTGAIRESATGKAVPYPLFGRGSKIRYGDRFVVLGERGTLALVDVDAEKFVERARASYKDIRYPAWAAPVLSRQRLFLRDEDTLLCLDLAPKKP